MCLEAESPKHKIEGMSKLADLNLSQGRFERSKTLYKKAIETAKQSGIRQQESEAHKDLAYLYLRTENYEEALKECEEAAKIDSELKRYDWLERDLLYRVQAHLGLKSISEAQKATEELRAFSEKEKNKRLMCRYYLASSRIEIERKNFENISCLCKREDLWYYTCQAVTSLISGLF